MSIKNYVIAGSLLVTTMTGMLVGGMLVSVPETVYVPGPTETRTIHDLQPPVTVTVSASLPAECARALEIAKKLDQAIRDYSHKVAPLEDTISEAQVALAGRDFKALNKADSDLTDISDNSTGELIKVVKLRNQFAEAEAAC